MKETIKDEINCRNHKKHDRLAATSDPGKYRTRRYARRQVEIGEGHVQKANVIFKELLPMLEELLKNPRQAK